MGGSGATVLGGAITSGGAALAGDALTGGAVRAGGAALAGGALTGGAVLTGASKRAPHTAQNVAVSLTDRPHC
jgi:hypothetical protein